MQQLTLNFRLLKTHKFYAIRDILKETLVRTIMVSRLKLPRNFVNTVIKQKKNFLMRPSLTFFTFFVF